MDRIWEKDPLAVIHVGVAGSRKSIDLEIQSKNGVYDKKDVLGKIGCRDCKDGGVTVVEGPGLNSDQTNIYSNIYSRVFENFHQFYGMSIKLSF